MEAVGTDAGLLSLTLLAQLAAAVRGDVPEGLVASLVALLPAIDGIALKAVPGTPYSRQKIYESSDLEVMIANWEPDFRCAPHDHGGSGGFVALLRGSFNERRFAWDGPRLVVTDETDRSEADWLAFGPEVIHDMVAPVGGLTLHAYSPPPQRMNVYDLERQEVLDLVGNFGAWIPAEDVPRTGFADAAAPAGAPEPADADEPAGPVAAHGKPVIWVAHTIQYRGGSAAFAVAADTMVRELAAAQPDADVQLARLDGKADFVAEMDRLAAEGRQIRELHFIGHSGMYGPMFKSTEWPEQFSPHEWREMHIPFAPDGRASFHACRTARWFAPFFARTFDVPCSGNRGYTTVSARKDRFAWAGRAPEERRDLYLVATPGKKSHGVAGSLRKYAGAPVEPMTEYLPADPDGVTSYDKVAELYDAAYVDIRVREAEWAWIIEHADQARRELGRPFRIAEIGCGNGALLRALDDRGDLDAGFGFDDSVAMVGRAQTRSDDRDRLQFARIDGPVIDLPDDSVDVVLSFLSFRYLDWDPIMEEVRRVLAPGGRLWVVDMVAQPVRARELPLLASSTLTHLRMPKRHPQFDQDLHALTSHPDWLTMLRYNPIRAEHEYRWFLESRFPASELEVLTVTTTQRVVAFDSGPLEKGVTEPLSYP
ncbi:MAG TPA: methyltransferase domain-containing protein [Acidimicrobiales bacterium]|nr:methyltransferase domain-containing protein [Acidimicrobiales bacterium]